MSSLSTHVLDAGTGTPAGGVAVTLTRLEGAGWAELGSAVTDDDGRVAALAPGGLAAGSYRLSFDTGSYFAARGQVGFYPEVTVTFTVDSDRHYHVPLLLSPFAYSTYRGS
ncbi:MAG: hydroxyisourate hydrolase [Geodermatophilaceae bacterium]